MGLWIDIQQGVDFQGTSERNWIIGNIRCRQERVRMTSRNDIREQCVKDRQRSLVKGNTYQRNWVNGCSGTHKEPDGYGKGLNLDRFRNLKKAAQKAAFFNGAR